MRAGRCVGMGAVVGLGHRTPHPSRGMERRFALTPDGNPYATRSAYARSLLRSSGWCGACAPSTHWVSSLWACSFCAKRVCRAGSSPMCKGAIMTTTSFDWNAPLASVDYAFELLTTGPGQPVLALDGLDAVAEDELTAEQVVPLLRRSSPQITDALGHRVLGGSVRARRRGRSWPSPRWLRG